MRNNYLYVFLAFFAATLLFGCNHENTAKQQQIEAGKYLATEKGCLACHGKNGEGVANFPRLAGLPEHYIIKQLEDFARVDPLLSTNASPRMRDNELMSPIAQTLAEGDMQNMAAYFSALPFVTESKAGDAESQERGQRLALQGKPEQNIPSCASCHGDKGIGRGNEIPPLSGQSASYLIDQLSHWQTGKRNNDQTNSMHEIANKLSDVDKVDVAAYYSGLPYQVNVNH